jgi:ABC-type antimicrobial peptide transport system permease subunit
MSITFAAAKKRFNDRGVVIDHTECPPEIEVRLANASAFEVMGPVLDMCVEPTMDYCGMVEQPKLDLLIAAFEQCAKTRGQHNAYFREVYGDLTKLAIYCRRTGLVFAWA